MANEVDTRTQIGCLVTLAILLPVLSYMAAGSLNPLAVYGSNSILAKIFVSLLAIILASSLLGLLFSYLMNKPIEITTGKPAEDAICPGCGLPLMQYVGSHGMPIRCPMCGEWWHNGPACYNKGMPRRKIPFPTYPCPHCRSASRDRDLFDDEDFMRFT